MVSFGVTYIHITLFNKSAFAVQQNRTNLIWMYASLKFNDSYTFRILAQEQTNKKKNHFSYIFMNCSKHFLIISSQNGMDIN